MPDVKLKYDIRVVRMAKSSSHTKLTNILEKMADITKNRKEENRPENMNLCLGHFDVMMIDGETAVEKNPLHWMIDDYNKTSDLGRMLGQISEEERKRSDATSYFPIYMLLQIVEPSSEVMHTLTEFWGLCANYTVVMRLHRDRSNGQEPFRNLLLERLKCIDEDEGGVCIRCDKTVSDFYANFAVEGNGIRIHCALYDSLELGDVVAILKGNSLRMILQIQRWLYESKYVNDAYSYCGIRYSLLQKAIMPEKQIKRIPKTKIDYVETRFSVRNSDIAWNLLDKSGRKGYFVTGSSDALIHDENLEEPLLLQRLCALIHDEMFYNAFSAVVTRVGLENRKPPRHVGEEPSEQSCKEIKLSAALIDWLSTQYRKSSHPDGEIYAYSLEKLVSSLNAMHSNSVTDDLSKLMNDGIEALLMQLEYYQTHNYWYESLGEELQAFLDQWSSTTNEILHLESQLFQHPELVPVRFYIPAMILQFQQLIVKKAMEVVRKIDNTQKSEYIPIMLPKSQNNTQTRAILDPKEVEEYTQKSPLCIFVPIHMLYHPYRVSVILCHEIAHYCGHSIRNRPMRNNTIKQCMAYYATVRMIIEMGLISGGTTPNELRENEEILNKVSTCAVRMAHDLDHLMAEDVQNGYLEDVLRVFDENISIIITDPKVITKMVKTLQTGQSNAAQQRICDKITLEGYSSYANLVCNCQEHMHRCLEPLLRECFADVLMVLLSDCSFDDYYRCMFHDEYENLEKKQYAPHEDRDAIQETSYETQTDRMALVACCINSIRPGWCDHTLAENRNDLWKDMTCDKVDVWYQSEEKDTFSRDWMKKYERSESSAYALLGYEAELILKYLGECAKSINAKLDDQHNLKDVEKLREQINLMKSSHMDWNKLQNQLRENTETI